MMRPCSTPPCCAMANAAGKYCDSCDSKGMPEGWSRTRDEAWLAGRSTAQIKAIPLPDRTRRLVLVQVERRHSTTKERYES